MNKLEIKETFLDLYKSNLKDMQGSIETSTREAWDSPGANQSHSDTNKYQLSNLALGKSNVESEYREAITKIDLLSVDSLDTVRSGAILQIIDRKSSEKKTYYVIPSCGGETIIYDGMEIMTISINAPIATICLGKEEGDEFDYKGKKFEILRVW